MRKENIKPEIRSNVRKKGKETFKKSLPEKYVFSFLGVEMVLYILVCICETQAMAIIIIRISSSSSVWLFYNRKKIRDSDMVLSAALLLLQLLFDSFSRIHAQQPIPLFSFNGVCIFSRSVSLTVGRINALGC